MVWALGRGFSPWSVLFDGWYASLENLKQVRDHRWPWLTRLKGNRRSCPRLGSPGRSTGSPSATPAEWSICGATA
ncbi:MAG TPA: hypothetical protein VF590_11445 [Isosphaeraceae bacterium]